MACLQPAVEEPSLPPVTLAVKRKRSYVVEVPYMCLRKLRKRLYSVIDLTNQPMEY